MNYRRWSKRDIEYLIYNYGIKSIEEIGNFLQRTPNSIYKKAKRLKLTNPMNKWSLSETNYLIEKWGIQNLDRIAEQLNRSKISIKKKALELNLGPSRIGNGNYLTTGDIGYLLNKNPNLIYRWVRDGYIRGRKFGGKNIFQIEPEDFISFLKENPQRWDSNEARLDLLKCYVHKSYELPEWFKEKINNDKKM